MWKNLVQGVEKGNDKVTCRFNDSWKIYLGAAVCCPFLPFDINGNGLSVLLIKRRLSLLGWKVTIYLLLYNKTPKIWWLKTMLYCFSWFCGLTGQVMWCYKSHSNSCTELWVWWGQDHLGRFVLLLMVSHSIWCVILWCCLRMLPHYSIFWPKLFTWQLDPKSSCQAFLKLKSGAGIALFLPHSLGQSKLEG